MESSEKLLRDIEASHLSTFLERFSEKKFDTVEFVKSLTSKQTDRLWTGVLEMAKEHISPVALAASDADEEPNWDDNALGLVHQATRLAQATLDQNDVYICPSLCDVARILHGVVHVVPEQVQESLLNLFIEWWTGDREAKYDLIAMTVPCLIARSISPDASVETVKCLVKIFSALPLFDFDDDSTESLQNLLFHCFIHPLFLSTDVGCRFLAFLFQLGSRFAAKLHNRVKENIPVCSEATINAYGKIYFRVWREASGEYREMIENVCIGDLIMHAVLAQRKGIYSMARRLRHLLSHFHEKKTVTGVDEMLCRLYSPILWRNLTATNPYVRANAVALLVEIFPLRNPSAPKSEFDALVQKQLEALDSMLFDDFPTARAIAVSGVCRVATLFWELLPKSTLKHLITKVVQDLAFDPASSLVRIEAIKGLTVLLENRLSHPLLKTLLPLLKNHIHDTTARVRVVLVDLLKVVKHQPFMKYWAVVQFDDLLYRLQTDCRSVKVSIVDLLLSSAMERSPEERIDRCIALLRTNRLATYNFYKFAFARMSNSAIAQFLELLISCVLSVLGRGDVSSSFRVSTENLNLSENADEVTGLLEIAALASSSFKKMPLKLTAMLRKSIPVLLESFSDKSAKLAVLLIASRLPEASRPDIDCMKYLKEKPQWASAENYGPFIECLCLWRQGGRLLDLIHDWLRRKPLRSDKKSSKRRKTSKERENYPRVALDFLEYIFLKRDVIDSLAKEKERLQNIIESLKTLIDNNIDDQEISSDAMAILVRLWLFLLVLKKGDEDDILQMIKWAEELIEKREIDETNSTLSHFQSVVATLFDGCVEVIRLGADTTRYRCRLNELAARLLSATESAEPFFPSCFKLIYQLSQILARPYEDPPTWPGNQLTTLCQQFLPVFCKEIDADASVAHKIRRFHSAYTEMLLSFNRHATVVASRDSVTATPMHSVVCVLLKSIGDARADDDDDDHSNDLAQEIGALTPASSFLLKPLMKTALLKQDFLSKLSRCVDSGAISSNPKSLHAALDLVSVFGRDGHSDVRNVLSAVKNQLHNIPASTSGKERLLVLVEKLV